MPRLTSYPAALAALYLLPTLASLCTAQSGPSSHCPYLYRWTFEAGGLPESELPDGVRGGELTVSGGELDHVPLFQKKEGVSDASPGVLNASRNSYGSADAAQINSFGSPLRTGKPSEQFTITMWVKPQLPADQQPQARLLNISPANNEQGSQSVFLSLESDGLAFCVNGSAYYKAEVTEPVIKPNEWVFLVFCYDGRSTNPYYSSDMINALESAYNGAILAGSQSRRIRLISKPAINTGAPTYAVSPGTVSLDGLLVAIGSSNSRYDRPFVGWIDDVRIYNGLLTTSDLERVRLEALGK